MKKRSVTKLLSIVLAASMIATSAAPATALAAEVSVTSDDENPGEGLGVAEETTVETEPAAEIAEEQNVSEPSERIDRASRAVYEDGVIDNWTQDKNTVIGDEAVNELVDGTRYLKAGAQNGNNHGNSEEWPAVFVNPNEFDFAAEGFFEFTVNTKENPKNNRFGIFLGYKDPGNGMFIGYDDYSQWYWQQYKDGTGTYTPISGTSYPKENTSVHVRVSWTADKKVTVTVDENKIVDALECADFIYTNKIGFKCSGFGSGSSKQLTEVWLSDIHYTGQKEVATYAVSGKVTDAAGAAIAGATVELNGNKATTAADGSYTLLEVPAGTHTVKVYKDGYETASQSITVQNAPLGNVVISLAEESSVGVQKLSTAEMDVFVAEDFPSVVKYLMKKGDLKDKVFYGQTEKIDTIKINGEAIKVTSDNLKATFDAATGTYVMSLKKDSADNPIDCVITAVITAKDNTASFDITKVENKLTETEEVAQADGSTKKQEKYPVQRIEIPNHSLLSVNSAQNNANMKGARTSSDTGVSGDSYVDVTDSMTFKTGDYVYAFVSNDSMSAGLWSNSEHTGSYVASPVGAAGGAGNTRVQATVTDKGTAKILGLASAEWYYDRKISTRLNQKTGESVSYVVEHTDMPSAKVALAGEMNGDDTVNWQDGAIAFRDIMNTPQGSEEVPELVNQRIAMNFGSQAANPFLSTLDGVKRVYLNTEGLGQAIILKGYGSEGHDSGHPDYGDIGKCIGGADDMNTLIAEGQKLGAIFGVHINASEMYTEAKAFNNDLSAGNYGWNWLDQGIGINSYYDLGSGARASRLKSLHDQVGDGNLTSETPGLNYIYLDVWGNGTTTNGEDSWESRQIAKQINDLGWRFTTEWGSTMEYDSTLQHWAADLKYGNAAAKGQNSEVMRFLRNHQKDSWIGDYGSYGGEAEAPLLGGLTMTDFEGWSSRTDYDEYITKMFRHNVITKFLQHYQVVKWEDAPESDAYSFTHQINENTHTHSWVPTKEITLENTEDAADDTKIVVTRKSTDHSNLNDYRSRTITMNGVEISKGAVTSGDDGIVGNAFQGDETYLIPWNWATDGSELSQNDQKLYHWNTKGGTTTWTLTDDWKGLSNVVVYKLTADGKTDKQTVNVVNNKITLKAEAEVPYVVYKGEKANLTVDWQSTQYIYDTGFNDSAVLTNYWTTTGSGKAEIAENISANRMLKLNGEVAVSSKALTGLTPKQRYAVYVGVDNRSSADAYMEIKSGGKRIAYNYTGTSYIANMVSSDQHHTGSGGVEGRISYFQNMFVFFTAPETGEVTLTLGRRAGGDEGAVYFDDIRVVPTEMDADVETNADGIITKLNQNFENNVQGIWPFVISGPQQTEGWVTDNRIHLSEYNGEYTKAGYKDKRVDDVLDGNWSVKINGLTGNRSMIYQTIPQNFRFEPGVTYNVSFDYQAGSDGTYELRVGDGKNNNVTALNMPGTSQGQGEDAVTKTTRCSFTVTGSASGESWFGIYSTGNAADLKEFTGLDDPKYNGKYNGQINFSGYKDFILDNLTIEKAGFTLSEDKVIARTAKDPIYLSVKALPGVELGKVTWSSENEDVAVVDEDGKVLFYNFGTTLIKATAIVNGQKQTVSCPVTLLEEETREARFEKAWANTGAESVANIIDGELSTNWQSEYKTEDAVDADQFMVSTENPAVVTVQLPEGEDFSNYNKLVFHERSDGLKGIVLYYECVFGSEFDENTHTIKNGVTTGRRQVESYAQSGVEKVEIPEGANGRYAQIRVSGAYLEAAVIAEVYATGEFYYKTEEEEKNLIRNQMQRQLDDLQKQLDAAKKEQEEAKAELERLKNASEAEKAAAQLQLKKAQEEAEKLRKELNDLKNKDMLKKGDTVVYKNVTYKVLDPVKKTAAAVKAKNVTSIAIAKTVKVNGVTCSVTEIASNAFKGAKKLKKAVIGANVTKIGKRAFYGAKKLRTVSIKTTKLKSVGSQAFGKIYVKAKITVPKSKKAAYKKLLKNKVPKKAIIK